MARRLVSPLAPPKAARPNVEAARAAEETGQSSRWQSGTRRQACRDLVEAIHPLKPGYRECLRAESDVLSDADISSTSPNMGVRVSRAAVVVTIVNISGCPSVGPV